MSNLTNEQRAMIENKRKIAQQKLKAKYINKKNNQIDTKSNVNVSLSGLCELVTKNRFSVKVPFNPHCANIFCNVISSFYGL